MMEKDTWLIDKKRQIYSDTMKRIQAIVFSEQLMENPFLNLHANLGQRTSMRNHPQRQSLINFQACLSFLPRNKSVDRFSVDTGMYLQRNP